MSEIISGQRVPDAERWQLPDIARGDESTGPANEESARTTHTIEALHEQARTEGYEQGLAEGRSRGYEDAYEQGKAQVEEQVRQFQELIASMRMPLRDADDEFMQEMGLLALKIGRAVAGFELQVAPEHVVDIARAAIAEIPAESRKIRLKLNPDDVTAVQEHAPELADNEEIRIVSEKAIARGECQVSSEGSHVDATLNGRIAVLAERMLDTAFRERLDSDASEED